MSSYSPSNISVNPAAIIIPIFGIIFFMAVLCCCCCAAGSRKGQPVVRVSPFGPAGVRIIPEPQGDLESRLAVLEASGSGTYTSTTASNGDDIISMNRPATTNFSKPTVPSTVRLAGSSDLERRISFLEEMGRQHIRNDTSEGPAPNLETLSEELPPYSK